MICWLLGIWYTARHWIRGGYDGNTVSGHSFMEAEQAMDTRTEYGQSFMVEVQWLVCEHCGKRDHYWAPYYGNAP